MCGLSWWEVWRRHWTQLTTDKHHIERGARRCIIRSRRWGSLAVVNAADTPNRKSRVIRGRGRLEAMSRLVETKASIIIVDGSDQPGLGPSLPESMLFCAYA
jgi:hypothetical protein